MTHVRIADAEYQLSELVNRAVDSHELIVLTSDEQAKAVLLSVEAFEDLVRMREHSHRELMPLNSFQMEFQQGLAEAGYDSREKILSLVREIKQEMAAEREQKMVAQEQVS